VKPKIIKRMYTEHLLDCPGCGIVIKDFKQTPIDTFYCGKCGKCGKLIVDAAHDYCGWCGEKIDWD